MRKSAFQFLLIAVACCAVAGCFTAKSFLTAESLARRRTTIYCHYHSELKSCAVRQDPERRDLYEIYAKMWEGLYAREEPIVRYLLAHAPDRILLEHGQQPAVDPDINSDEDLDNNKALIEEYRKASARDARVRADLGEVKKKLCISMWNNARQTKQGRRAEKSLRTELNALAVDVERWIKESKPERIGSPGGQGQPTRRGMGSHLNK
jgi:hypothetical protein